MNCYLRVHRFSCWSFIVQNMCFKFQHVFQQALESPKRKNTVIVSIIHQVGSSSSSSSPSSRIITIIIILIPAMENSKNTSNNYQNKKLKHLESTQNLEKNKKIELTS